MFASNYADLHKNCGNSLSLCWLSVFVSVYKFILHRTFFLFCVFCWFVFFQNCSFSRLLLIKTILFLTLIVTNLNYICWINLTIFWIHCLLLQLRLKMAKKYILLTASTSINARLNICNYSSVAKSVLLVVSKTISKLMIFASFLHFIVC